MMMAKHTIVRFRANFIFGFGLEFSFRKAREKDAEAKSKAKVASLAHNRRTLKLSGGYDCPQERLRSHLGFRAGTQRVGGAMAERDEEPTAFSVVVNGQIELAEVRARLRALPVPRSPPGKGQRRRTDSRFLSSPCSPPHPADSRQQERVLQVPGDSRGGLAGTRRPRGGRHAPVEEGSRGRHQLRLELSYQRGLQEHQHLWLAPGRPERVRRG